MLLVIIVVAIISDVPLFVTL